MDAYRITVSPGGHSFDCRSNESLLEAMRRNRGQSIYGCYGGGCGVCKIQVRSGRYIQFKTMSRAHVTHEEQENGMVLACCIRPLEDMTIGLQEHWTRNMN